MSSLSRPRSRSTVGQSVVEALVQFSNGHPACYPSLDELSRAAGISRRAVCQALQDLKKCRVLMSSHRFASDGRQLTNQYRLVGDAIYREKGMEV